MPSINMRQLRDTRQLKTWLRSGQTVELRDRDQVVGRIVPEKPVEKEIDWAAFDARRKKILGNKKLPGVELLLEERERSRY